MPARKVQADRQLYFFGHVHLYAFADGPSPRGKVKELGRVLSKTWELERANLKSWGNCGWSCSKSSFGRQRFLG